MIHKIVIFAYPCGKALESSADDQLGLGDVGRSTASRYALADAYPQVFPMSLVLASTSAIRRQLLDGVGLDYRAKAPDFDEDAAKRDLAGETLALELAKGKALSLATGDDWVIGADSTLTVDGRAFSKPRERDEAAEHLRFFSGRTMTLSSAVALARAEEIDWSHADSAMLRVRRLSEEFIDSYLDAEWPEVGYCVGVFRMEGRGATLFDTVEGSHFTILGLPLLPLLGALRQRGMMTS